MRGRLSFRRALIPVSIMCVCSIVYRGLRRAEENLSGGTSLVSMQHPAVSSILTVHISAVLCSCKFCIVNDDRSCSGTSHKRASWVVNASGNAQNYRNSTLDTPYSSRPTRYEHSGVSIRDERVCGGNASGGSGRQHRT